MIRFLLLSLLLVAGGDAFCQSHPNFTQTLERPAVLRGEFEQRKHLTGFRNPLRSSGRFVVARERGAIWETTHPFPSTVVVTGDRILSRAEDGSQDVLLDTSGSNQSAAGAMLVALLAGDIDALEEMFDLQESPSSEGLWQLRLIPRQAGMRQVVSRIELRGDRYVRHVILHEQDGSKTEIDFLSPVQTPASLTRAESELLD